MTRPRVARAARPLGLLAWQRFRGWLARRQPDLVGRWRWWLGVSALAVVVALAGIAVNGVTYGLEFSGGRLLEYQTARSIDVEALRDDLADAGLPRAIVQSTGDAGVSIRSPELSPSQEKAVRDAVAAAGGEADVVRDEFVGPTIGAELRRNALIALGIALGAQLLYLAFRFRWTYGTAAVVAMAHDVAILLGVFAWLGKPFDGVFLAALLTVVGYSINDSVVVFDRIREERQLDPRRPIALIANDAALQTLPRTVNTGMGAWFVLLALYALGADSLTDFALALLIGTGVGMYSSVFTAAPVAVLLERWSGPSRAAHPRQGLKQADADEGARSASGRRSGRS